MRFLLGAAEAGFFPGIIFYLTQWFPARERARTIAAFMTASLTAGIVGGPVSGALLSMNGVGGLAGWQWLFLLEGLPAIVLGVVVLFYMTERPEDAALAVGCRTRRRSSTRCDATRTPAVRRAPATAVGGALASGRIWLLAIVYFTIPIALYAFGFWLPQIIRAASNGSDFQVGLLTAIPYLVGACGMVIAARHSDRTGERRWHIVGAALVGGGAFVVSAFVQTLAVSLVDAVGGDARPRVDVRPVLGVRDFEASRRRRRGGHRADQFDRQHGRIRRTLCDRVHPRPDTELHGRSGIRRRGARRHTAARPRRSPTTGRDPMHLKLKSVRASVVAVERSRIARHVREQPQHLDQPSRSVSPSLHDPRRTRVPQAHARTAARRRHLPSS